MAAAVLLTILAIATCACIGYMIGLVTSTYYSKKTTRIKVKAIDTARFLDHLHKKCIEARDAEPFAAWMADEITNHLTKD